MKTLTSLLIGAVLVSGSIACQRGNASRVNSETQPASPPSTATAEQAMTQLTQQLETLKSKSGGDVAISIVHVETGRRIDLDGAKKLPLFSVFKLPVAISVLKEVEKQQLQLDKQIKVTPADVAPGTQYNADLWRKPVDRTVAQLIEVSIVRSDNTSTDKLLELVGGAAGVTGQMRSLGLANIDVVSTTREFIADRNRPNTGSATDLADLLVKLQSGELLQPANADLLVGFITRAKTGERRLRGKMPAGTVVADKTGTGETNTNDVGIITLPEGRGHLAIAVLMNGSKLSNEAQEDVIADVARAAYDSFASIAPARP